MKFSNPFKTLTKFELGLYLSSLVVCISSFFFSGMKDYLALVSSTVGVTSLIFLAKGHVFGQMVAILFALLYGLISFFIQYYGELITYVCMSMPMAIVSLISWIKHPYQDTDEVEVSKVTKKNVIVVSILTVVVTVIFYFILKAIGNNNLIVSTISVATSFFAASLTFLRSPYYAIAYSVNDIVLIILWILASVEQISYLPMVFCFVMFLVNDLYGFYNWRKMQKNQKSGV